MGVLRDAISNFRTSPRLLQAPPFVTLLCFLGGIIWILLLPLDEYSRQTYVSENALLPGQVHTYFHGSEQNIARAYRNEISDVIDYQFKTAEDGSQQVMQATPPHRNDKIQQLFSNSGIKSARQSYRYDVNGHVVEGENVYGIVNAPRGDGTESLVLIAPVKNYRDQLNPRGVALLLTLARYFSRWSLWSKDIILLVTPDTAAGPQAWIDAYLGIHNADTIAGLELKSGAIQGVIVIDFPTNHNFHQLNIDYDGVNGQLPNLDLINTAAAISSSQANIPVLVQSQHEYADRDKQHHYVNRLKAMGHGMRNQAIGQSTGAHSVFMPYHIDAITLTAIGEGPEDEMAFGRVVESLVRSLNNLLEKLHQSFFFYLLLQNVRFVSIGTYLPSAMGIGAGFSIMAIYLWIKSGYEEQNLTETGEDKSVHDPGIVEVKLDDGVNALVSSKTAADLNVPGKKTWRVIDRPIVLPLIIIVSVYAVSFLPLAILTLSKREELLRRAYAVAIVMTLLPIGVTFMLTQNPMVRQLAFPKYVSSAAHPPKSPTFQESHYSDVSHPTHDQTRKPQFYQILTALCLLVLGLQVTVLATINFSLAFFIGIFCMPLAFAGFYPTSPTRAKLSLLALTANNPFFVIISAIVLCKYLGLYGDEQKIKDVLAPWLEQICSAWSISRSWSVFLGLFTIWIPAWAITAVSVISNFIVDDAQTLLRTSTATSTTK